MSILYLLTIFQFPGKYVVTQLLLIYQLLAIINLQGEQGSFSSRFLNFKAMADWSFARTPGRCETKKETNSLTTQSRGKCELKRLAPTISFEEISRPRDYSLTTPLKICTTSLQHQAGGTSLFYMSFFGGYSKFKLWHNKCLINSYRIND